MTQAGLDLLDHVRTMGKTAILISMAAEGQSQKITGEVTVSSTDLMSALILPKMLSPLRQKVRGLGVRLKSANQIDNLLRREADIAIRPDQSDLIVRHVSDIHGNFYASRTYLDKEGRLLTLRKLADYDFVGNPDQERLIGPLNDRGVPLSEASFVISSESGVITWELVKSGYGISMLPEVLCKAEPDIERVLPIFASMAFTTRSGTIRPPT